MWRKTIVVGAEHDLGVREALSRALAEAGAVRIRHRMAVAGSQQIETWRYRVDRQRLEITAETYVGLSLRGAAPLVERLAAAVHASRAA